MNLFDLSAVGQRVAGHGREVKRGAGHLGQHDALAELIDLADQQAAGLRNSFDDERVGHHRSAGKMVVQVLLGQRHVLDGDRVAATFELKISIDPEPTHGANLQITNKEARNAGTAILGFLVSL